MSVDAARDLAECSLGALPCATFPVATKGSVTLPTLYAENKQHTFNTGGVALQAADAGATVQHVGEPQHRKLNLACWLGLLQRLTGRFRRPRRRCATASP